MEDDPDAAIVALNRVRQAAESRGEVRRRRPAATGRGTTAGSGSGSGSGTAPGWRRGPDARDPRMVGDVFGRLVTERGWSSPVAVGSVLSRWDELVGADIGLHCRPESFENAVVTVRCDSTAWATQLKLLTPALLQRFEQALGPGIVTSLRVAGPSAPSWRKGPRVVKGRGPRDTYG
ncbi:DUF721 domain-containing protein [Cellulosimicrobium funkei]|nr:DUF721 domain-containing protein [Cellulosimicrobium funkei]